MLYRRRAKMAPSISELATPNFPLMLTRFTQKIGGIRIEDYKKDVAEAFPGEGHLKPPNSEIV